MADVRLLQGDCLEVMATLEENSVDAIVTDPPYGLSFMGKHWDHGIPGPAFWVEALRVAKPGAHLLAFGGTRTFHRLACAIEDAGWEIRDTVMWVYGSGFPKSHNLKGDWQGWGTALKPAWEPIIVARKPLQGTVAANVLAWGTGALNVDGCRVGHSDPDITRRNFVSPNGIYQPGAREGERGAGPAPTGRWPANFIHDGSEEVVGLMPTVKAGVAVRRNVGHSPSSNINYATGSQDAAMRQDVTYGDSGSAARFFYCAKASKADRDEGLDGMEERRVAGAVGMQRVTARNWGDDSETVYERKTVARNHHPTVKPTALMRYLCRLVTPPGGVVLDPFMGSGSTGKAAMAEGFRFIGIELDPEYLAIAQARIDHAEMQPRLPVRTTMEDGAIMDARGSEGGPSAHDTPTDR